MERNKGDTVVDANTFRNLFCENNAHREEIYDHQADRFLGQVHRELVERYDRGEWVAFTECTQLGISLYETNRQFDNFIYSFGWILVEETLAEKHGMPTFEEFFSKVDYEKESYECCGFQDEEINYFLKPFVEALQRKGFDVYFDEENRGLVVAFNIIDDQK